MSDQFPNITKAALELSYDAGGINRERTEENLKRELGECLDMIAPQGWDFPAIDAWLGSLPEDQLFTACCGEETDQLEILKSAPPHTDDLLNVIFDEVA